MKLVHAARGITLAVLPAAQALAEPTPIHVRKTNGCGCCLAWMDHLAETGFAPTSDDMFAGLLVRFKLDNGVPQRMVSCHTAQVGGYIIRGHIPARDFRRLLGERPGAVGLTVPDMPLGPLGMDQGRRTEAYNVFLMRAEGSAEVVRELPGRLTHGRA